MWIRDFGGANGCVMSVDFYLGWTGVSEAAGLTLSLSLLEVWWLQQQGRRGVIRLSAKGGQI